MMTRRETLIGGNWTLSIFPVAKGVAKGIKALNHEGHEGHKGKEKLFFVIFVSFVVPFFSGSFATPSFARMAADGGGYFDLCSNLEGEDPALIVASDLPEVTMVQSQL